MHSQRLKILAPFVPLFPGCNTQQHLCIPLTCSLSSTECLISVSHSNNTCGLGNSAKNRQSSTFSRLIRPGGAPASQLHRVQSGAQGSSAHPFTGSCARAGAGRASAPTECWILTDGCIVTAGGYTLKKIKHEHTYEKSVP